MTWNRGIHKWKWVALFLAPSLIGLTIFILYPILSSFWLAFQEWNLLSPPPYPQKTSSQLKAHHYSA